MRNLKIDYIGDSLTYYDQWTVQTEASFGLIYHNLGVGSKCLCGEPYPNNPRMWEDSILNAVIAHDTDIVTIMGGANDFGQMHPIGNVAEQTALPLKQKDKNTFAGAYSYIVERLLQWKPSLRIILMEFVTDHMEEKNRLGISDSDYNLCANEIAAHYGLEIARTQEAGAFSHETYAELLIDRVHPSFAGAQIYARTLSNILSESGEE